MTGEDGGAASGGRSLKLVFRLAGLVFVALCLGLLRAFADPRLAGDLGGPSARHVVVARPGGRLRCRRNVHLGVAMGRGDRRGRR